MNGRRIVEEDGRKNNSFKKKKTYHVMERLIPYDISLYIRQKKKKKLK